MSDEIIASFILYCIFSVLFSLAFLDEIGKFFYRQQLKLGTLLWFIIIWPGILFWSVMFLLCEKFDNTNLAKRFYKLMNKDLIKK